jgi:hypothetical protein
MKIQQTKMVWVVWGNTDLTEGRGRKYPLHICEEKATALRLGAKGYVQGSACPIEEIEIPRIEGMWFAPANIVSPTEPDKREQERLDELNRTLEKAESLGLTKEDINILLKNTN